MIGSEILDGYENFSEGLVLVLKGGLIFKDAAGQTKINPIAITTAEFKEDLAFVRLEK